MKTSTVVNTEATQTIDAPLQYPDAQQEADPPQTFTPPYPPLAQVTKPNLTTDEMAYYANQAPQTWRVHACRETFPDGLRPVRIGGRLNWPTAGAKKLCGVQS